jgi:hypothetical protein
MGDIVATVASPGHDWNCYFNRRVKIQMKKKGANLTVTRSKIYRKASQKDIDIWSAAREKEKNQ